MMLIPQSSAERHPSAEFRPIILRTPPGGGSIAAFTCYAVVYQFIQINVLSIRPK